MSQGGKMYLSHYGLNEKPFDISTDPKFLWLGEKHKEAFAVLKYGVMENKGFLLLTGDIGAGKTTLINALTNSVSDDVIYAFIPDPGLELMDFYRYLAYAFGCDDSFKNKADFIFMFKAFLHAAHEEGKKVLLIIDEAQRLSSALLEEIRLLSNIELHNSKLLNIFFVGQAEFNTKLLEPENRAVRQRITISNHIQPLTEKETGDYIRHRLKVAGSQKNIFSYVAIHEVYNFSAGYPRLINILCDIAMLTGYVRERVKISDDIVRESIESLNIEPHTPPPAKREAVMDDLDTALRYENKSDRVKPRLNRDVKTVEAENKPKRRWLLALLGMVVVLCVLAVLFFKAGELRRLISEHDMVDKGKALLSRLWDKSDSDVPGPETPVESQSTVSTSDGPESQDSFAMPKEESPAAPSSSFSLSRMVIDFSRNSNEFTDESLKKLSDLAGLLKQNPTVSVLVIGYTDDHGTYSYNVNLSSFRANSVKSYLIGQGIEKMRIRATGLGPDNPVASNDTKDGREKNRRVEIEILKQ